LKALGSVLKWIGGLAALLTLAIGVKQVGDIVTEWRDREVAVKQFVQAARMQTDLRDYPGAWQVIQHGLTIAPASHIALEQQVEVAMAWLRDIWRQKGKKAYSDIIDPLMPTLYRGAVSGDTEHRADVLAHIGWANHLRLRDKRAFYEVDEFFRHALERNPTNTYAHLFWGYWILYRENQEKYEGDRLEIAKRHFAAAVKTEKHRQYVNNWRLLALSRTYVTGADVETIRAANELRQRNQQLASWVRSAVLERFSGLYRTQFTEGEFLDRLFQHVSPTDLLAIYRWLSNDIDFEGDHPFGMPLENHKFVIAILTEATGDLRGAIDRYTSLVPELSGTSSLRGAVERAIKRAAERK
jgi:hypothetical protein